MIEQLEEISDNLSMDWPSVFSLEVPIISEFLNTDDTAIDDL